MRKTLLIFVAFLLSSIINSQENTRVIYKSILAKNGFAPILQELLIQESKSTFKVIKIEKPEKVFIDEITEEVFLHTETPDSIQPFIFSDFEKKEILTRTYISNNGGETYKVFNVIEPFDVQWEIKDEKIKIGAYNCNKAITKFRGRNYTVWYTDEIPISFGPWKFHGLPGLIIKMVDDKYEVNFLLEKIEYPFKESLNVDNSIFEQNTKIDDFFKIRTKAKEESRKVFESKLLAKLPRGAVLELTKKGNNEIEIEY